MALWSVDILTIFVQSNNTEHLSTYLCLLTFLSSELCSFPCTEPSPPRLTLFLRYFTAFDDTVNEIILSSLLVFCWYIETQMIFNYDLYPANILHLLISSNSFLVLSLGLSIHIYNKIPFANRDNVLLSYLCACYYCCCYFRLVALARTSNAMLNKSDGSGCPCLVPDLRGKALSSSPPSVMLLWVVMYVWPFLCCGVFPLYPVC